MGAPNDRPLLCSTSHDLGASEGRRRRLFKSYKLFSDASLGKVVVVRAQDMILKHNLEQLLANCWGGNIYPRADALVQFSRSKRQEIRSTSENLASNQ